ncbi:RNA-binding S4 domain-containing protein [Garicola koreensis]|uniref:Ribosome-associated protein n=1 Tax=Garicola koreensis TaxID=1262554 RepID=A0A7W5TQG5_9MICC|nr:RNA-binding S4 domain-containing protein [Garicola koreensis]MBB3667826.1 ribosome-associated protein [Garicola koreensis]
MSDETVEVPIRDESIRLGQLLKLAGAVESGVVAREVIAAGAVSVDGAPEDRRGARVALGQRVRFSGEEFGLPNLTLVPVRED